MASKSFSIKESISFGWETVKKQPVIILYVLVASAGSQLLDGLLSSMFRDAGDGFTGFIGLVTTLLSFVLSLGLLRVLLNVYAKKKIAPQNLYEDWRIVGWFILASLLNVVLVIAGLILLIIPGIYVAIRLSMWQYIMIEGEHNPVDAMKKSWKLTEGQVWQLFLLYLTQFALMILGLLALVIGLFVAIPVISLASVYVYKQLSGSK